MQASLCGLKWRFTALLKTLCRAGTSKPKAQQTTDTSRSASASLRSATDRRLPCLMNRRYSMRCARSIVTCGYERISGLVQQTPTFRSRLAFRPSQWELGEKAAARILRRNGIAPKIARRDLGEFCSSRWLLPTGRQSSSPKHLLHSAHANQPSYAMRISGSCVHVFRSILAEQEFNCNAGKQVDYAECRV